jgi:hypothetical protein
MRGVQRIECDPRPRVVEMDMHNNVKADKAATIKRRINPPRLSMGFSNGQGGQLLGKSKEITTVLQISLPGNFPRGRRENISGLRIQTAAKGVNGFVKSMRRQMESQPECEALGDFHHRRRGGRQMSFYSSSRGSLINLPGHTVECFVRAFFGVRATTPLEQFHHFRLIFSYCLPARSQSGCSSASVLIKRLPGNDPSLLLGDRRAHRYFHSPCSTKAAQ